ncbi:NAD(P)-dependent dehydrogenase (short-subunit alcohol dehydrogenase family) [Lipingzhangella halophila]|uniref:NAD(P)-dependent dehydrogenase (Short-subunit alcohol dehydrogenase family) n=1 Tax=Lipingzhangella halophila TaxID=1783352 RepID=A0A7W7RMY3_9ACTN|nr:glucose 1-dehydrogenase [Lipingzhangella halophila]MBB4934970.1 NAD(P)-dependent dehydrogenase (short-subunit alcohol dehydrogenase family) [Lipingzhangella halophila]
MAGRLTGRVALVSGGAGGQGASHARVLAEHGAKVVLGDIRDDEGQTLAESLREQDLDVRAVPLDVRFDDQWRAAVGFAERTFGHLDVLVNNAGISAAGGVEDENEDDWHRVIDVNQKGVWLGMRAAIPALRRAGGGSVINTASTFGIRPPASGIAYAASKGAVQAMTRSAAMAVADADIRVNTLVVSMVDTPFLDRAKRAGAVERRLREYPLGRIAQPLDVSRAVVFLASEESSYMTASEMVLDGGMLGGYTLRLDDQDPRPNPAGA